MQIFTNLCNVLTAASQYFKQLHLCAAQGGYSLHLLTNKIYNDLDEANDRLKELSISVSSNKKITIALNSLEAAANFCRQIPDSADTQNIPLMINNCTLILEDLGVLVERASAEITGEEIVFKQGLLNALGDISEKLAKDKYLLNMELSPLSAQAQDEFDESKVNRDDLGRFCEKLKEGVSKTETTTKQAEAKNNQSEEDQKKKAEAEKAIFTPSAELAEKFKKDANDILTDEEAGVYTKIDMGTIPQLYVNLGLPEQNLKISKLSLKKALGLLTEEELEENPQWHNHNVQRRDIDNLPALISDPLAVFKSYTVKGRYISVLDADFEGFPVLAILEPNQKKAGYTFIPSVYDRDNFEYFLNETQASNGIVYIDKERALLPETLVQAATIGNKAPINKILTKEDIVNSYLEKAERNSIKEVDTEGR